MSTPDIALKLEGIAGQAAQEGSSLPVISEMTIWHAQEARQIDYTVHGGLPARLDVSEALKTGFKLLLRYVVQEIPDKHRSANAAICKL